MNLAKWNTFQNIPSQEKSGRLKELESFCMQHPNILNINRCIGGKDFEIELQAMSFEEFEKIINELRVEFKGMIQDYEFVIAREEKKMAYFPFE